MDEEARQEMRMWQRHIEKQKQLVPEHWQEMLTMAAEALDYFTEDELEEYAMRKHTEAEQRKQAREEKETD